MSETPEELIFAAALEIASPADREKYLDAACGDDAVLRRRLDELLASHGRASRFLEVPAIGAAGVTTDPNSSDSSQSPFEATRPPSVVPGTQIGPYTLVRKLGEGGMGAVYLAAQEQPVRREVALKIIKPGIGGEQVIARFAAERQALERMDHPNIARVLDAGTTQAGLPYFVMELVEGVPITQYCDEKRLTPRQRLELFVPVCHAVQHAHQKGIIHRDLKPSNLLVAVYDAKPVPKVIDFGVAKAVEKLQVEQTAFTQLGVLIGTPEYMSPEQADLDAAGVDTRSDIYSLGVVLYELLTGTTPLEAQRLRQIGWAQMLKSIREDHPPRPSTRLSTSGAARAEISARRGTEARRLQRLLMGDLDQVVMKALEKECDRRYQTANGLARDIERYLDDEPVEARGPSTTYRLRKFAYKHRFALTVAAGFAGVLVAGTAVSTWEAIRAKQARDKAVQAESAANTQRDLAIAQRQRADEATGVSETVNQFLNEIILGEASPLVQEEHGLRARPDLTLREVLSTAAARVGPRFVGKPELEWRLRATIGNAYIDLGAFAEAQSQYERFLALAQSVRHNDRVVVDAMLSLGVAHSYRGDYKAAEGLFRDAIALSTNAFGENDVHTVWATQDLADTYSELGQHRKAEALYKQVMKAESALSRPPHEIVTTLNNLASCYEGEDRSAEAEPLLEKALAMAKTDLGPDHPSTLHTMSGLGHTEDRLGKQEAAEKLLLQAIDAQRRILGSNHPETASSATSLAILYRHMGRYKESENLLIEALKASANGNRVSPRARCEYLDNLAQVYVAEGRLDEADRVFEWELALSREALSLRHPFTLLAANNLASNRQAQGRRKEAESLFLEILPMAREVCGEDNDFTLSLLNNIGGLYREEHRDSDAERLYRDSLDGFRKSIGDRKAACHPPLSNLAILLAREGKYAQAEVMFSEALRCRKEELGEIDPDTIAVEFELARLYIRMGKFADADPLLAIVAQSTPSNHSRPSLRSEAVRFITGLKAAGDAEANYREAVAAGGINDPVTLAKQMDWAIALRGVRAYDQCERQTREIVSRLKADQDARPLVRARSLLALVHHFQGLNDLAASEYSELLRFARREAGDSDPVTRQVVIDLMQFSQDTLRFDKQLLDGVVEVSGGVEDAVDQLLNRGRCLLDAGNYVDSEVMLRKAVELSEGFDEGRWPAVNLARSALGGSLAGQRRFSEAEPLLLEAYQVIKSHTGETPRMDYMIKAEARRRVVLLYTSWGKPDLAEHWRSDPLPGDPPVAQPSWHSDPVSSKTSQ
jgi:serine/threonine protein kinase/tetratricopeptide (TPR) repeat protein